MRLPLRRAVLGVTAPVGVTAAEPATAALRPVLWAMAPQGPEDRAGAQRVGRREARPVPLLVDDRGVLRVREGDVEDLGQLGSDELRPRRPGVVKLVLRVVLECRKHRHEGHLGLHLLRLRNLLGVARDHGHLDVGPAGANKL